MRGSDSMDIEAADDDIRRLLAASGPRPRPPVEMEGRVRAAMMAAVDELPEPGHGRFPAVRRFIDWLGAQSFFRSPRMVFAAAAVLALTVGLFVVREDVPPGRDAMAGQIAYVSGGYTVRGARTGNSEQIANGAIVQTSAEGRMLVDLGGGNSVRIDHRTSATFHSNREIWLHRGRIYIDAAGEGSLRVTTPNASVTDIGTQFEIAVEGESLHIAVREGKIEVSTTSTVLQASADEGIGEVLSLDGMTLRERRPVATDDELWSWTQSARPSFRIGGRSVHDYLAWAARETGRTLVFESDLARQQARLRRFEGQGEVDTNVAQILRTTRFQLKEGAAHELIVGFPSV